MGIKNVSAALPMRFNLNKVIGSLAYMWGASEASKQLTGDFLW